jgi:hypothetical protein
MAKQATRQTLPVWVSPGDARIDEATLVIPDRVDASATGGYHRPERGEITGPVGRPLLRLSKESVIHLPSITRDSVENGLRGASSRSPRVLASPSGTVYT